jgi:hypothetical protein
MDELGCPKLEAAERREARLRARTVGDRRRADYRAAGAWGC